MDHDFLKGESRERPFTPPAEPSILLWLGVLLALLAIVYAGYRVNEWANHPPPSATRTQPPSNSSPPSRQASEHSPQTSIPSVTDPGARTITKCVISGKTSYGDGNCAGGVTTQVTTKVNQNLMTSVRPQVPAQTGEPASQIATVTKSESSNAGMENKIRCDALEAKIASLDAMARQPQTPQMQDWIKDERRKARDERFRIPCN